MLVYKTRHVFERDIHRLGLSLQLFLLMILLMMFMLSDLNVFFENWQKQNEIKGPQCRICRAGLNKNSRTTIKFDRAFHVGVGRVWSIVLIYCTMRIKPKWRCLLSWKSSTTQSRRPYVDTYEKWNSRDNSGCKYYCQNCYIKINKWEKEITENSNKQVQTKLLYHPFSVVKQTEMLRLWHHHKNMIV